MTILALALGLVAVVSIALLMTTRRSLARGRADLQAADEKKADQSAVIDEMASAAADQLDQLRELETVIEGAETEITRLEGDVELKASTGAELEKALIVSAAQLSEQESELGEQKTELVDLTHQTERLQEQLEQAHLVASKRTASAVPEVLLSSSEDGDTLDVPGFSPATAWRLELVRSERTWRYSVSTNPLEDASPFEDSESPLRLAIEIEALALREDVGAFIGIDWQAGDAINPDADPARAHLTLRLAQEMLAAAAREVEPSTLMITSDEDSGGLSLSIVAADGDDVDFNIPPPPIASEWIGIDEHGGMVVTIKND